MKSVHFQVKDFYVYTISEKLFHETDSFLAIIVDLWLSVAGKVRGRLEEKGLPLQVGDEEVHGRPPRLLRFGSRESPALFTATSATRNLRSTIPGYGPM